VPSISLSETLSSLFRSGLSSRRRGADRSPPLRRRPAPTREGGDDPIGAGGDGPGLPATYAETQHEAVHNALSIMRGCEPGIKKRSRTNATSTLMAIPAAGFEPAIFTLKG
jgi:hypothetical protein